MKKIQINNFKESVYYEKLENGLEVYLVPLNKKNGYYTTFGTKYGGRDIKFKSGGVLKETPTGIAHFLEHKLFEKEPDPFTFYQKSGTDVNASTSYDFTSYYIYGNKNYKQNLIYLLDWLQTLNITEELVKKEQGIILEEASMYKDNPDRVMNSKVKENVFVKDSIRNKVIGTDEDIVKITKEDLELCYNSFYNPENMFIISVGKFKPKEVIEIIKENTKDFKSVKGIEKYYEEEPDDVYKEYEEIYLNVDIPRVASAYKFNKNIFKELNIDKFSLDLYIHILINTGIGVTSDIREKWLKEELFINSSYKVTETKTHYVIEFNATSNKVDELVKELDDYLKDIKISKESFEREKKLWIAGEVKNISNVNGVAYNILDDILDYGEFIPNKIDYIRKLDYETLLKVKEILNFNNKAVVKLLPKEDE